MPERIQLKRTKGWRMPVDAIRVTRPSEFGNPFRVTKATVTHGVHAGDVEWWIESAASVWRFPTKAAALAGAVTLYRAWVGDPRQSHLVARAKLHLKGKPLACWCPLDQPCHADVLLELANPQGEAGKESADG